MRSDHGWSGFLKPETCLIHAGAKRQLTDAFFSELYGLLARRFVRRQADVLPLLRRRLLVVSERMFGPGVVTGVLISEPSRRRPVGS